MWLFIVADISNFCPQFRYRFYHICASNVPLRKEELLNAELERQFSFTQQLFFHMAALNVHDLFSFNVKVNFGQSNHVEQLTYACFKTSLKFENEKLFFVSIIDKIWLQEGK